MMIITKYKFAITAISISLNLVLNCLGQNVEPSELQKLVPNQLIERALTGAEMHRYQVDLSVNKLMTVRAEQKGIDIILRLFDQAGKKLAEIDSPNGTQGFEVLSYIPKDAGIYIIE